MPIVLEAIAYKSITSFERPRCPIRSGMTKCRFLASLGMTGEWMPGKTESRWTQGWRKPVAAAVRARVRKRKCAGASAGGGDAKRHDEHCPPTLRAARLVKGEVGSSSPRCRSVSALSSLHRSSNSRLPKPRGQIPRTSRGMTKRDALHALGMTGRSTRGHDEADFSASSK